jgi:hypothetical protein
VHAGKLVTPGEKAHRGAAALEKRGSAMLIEDPIGRAKTLRESLAVGTVAHDMITGARAGIDQLSRDQSASATEG